MGVAAHVPRRIHLAAELEAQIKCAALDLDLLSRKAVRKSAGREHSVFARRQSDIGRTARSVDDTSPGRDPARRRDAGIRQIAVAVDDCYTAGKGISGGGVRDVNAQLTVCPTAIL